MRFVDNEKITDPRLNLAIEEYLLRHVSLDEPILLFYINEPSVIIGRNQNTIEEIDPDYIKANQIHVVRRLSGGGAVFHDLGNLNFSFITGGREDLHNFAKFTEPVVRVLREMGVPAELRGKSDLFANNRKFSGNAQFSTTTGMFSHGTILFDTNLEQMLKALNPRQAQIESKAVQSIRNYVTNVREWLGEGVDTYGLRQALLQGIFGGGEIPTYQLTAADWQGIRQLSAERYANWEWNYGRSPRCNVQKSERFPVGKLDARIDVDSGRVQSLRIFGDFAGKRDVNELEVLLAGVPYDRDALAAALDGLDITPYFGELAKADFLNLLY
jgi:lipoate-protein ligase A